MYKTVTVIGLGSLGGFLTKYISELSYVRNITLVDFDTVEGKNVFDSIYNYTNIGEYKVDALYDIIKDDVAVTKLNQKYIEGQTYLPESDLVIDCRDVVCDRDREIDVRFYIAEKSLVIDCRKTVRNVCSYDGHYSIQLTKSEINKAAFYSAQIIESGHIKDMIKNNLIQRIDLNLVSEVMSNSIKETLSNKIDMIYDLCDSGKRLQCIQENVRPILMMNRAADIDVYIGDRETVLNNVIDLFPDEAKTKHAVIPKHSLNNSIDVIQSLTDIIKLQPGVTNYIVTVRKKGSQQYVELLEETGAA